MPKSKSRSKLLPSDGGPAQREATANTFIAKWFGFYKLCSNPHCRRANACKGETCFNAFWDYVPEREKERFRKCITARCNGASLDEAVTAGEAAAQAVDADEAAARLRAAVPVEAAPMSRPVMNAETMSHGSATAAPRPGPRIRVL